MVYVCVVVVEQNTELLIHGKGSSENHVGEEVEGLLEEGALGASSNDVLIVFDPEGPVPDIRHDNLGLSLPTAPLLFLAAVGCEHLLEPSEAAIDEDSIYVANHDASVFNDERQDEQIINCLIDLCILDGLADEGNR